MLHPKMQAKSLGLLWMGYAAANLLGDVLLVHTIKVHLPPQRPPNTAEALAKPRRIRE